jgi:hypothetical protein
MLLLSVAFSESDAKYGGLCCSLNAACVLAYRASSGSSSTELVQAQVCVAVLYLTSLLAGWLQQQSLPLVQALLERPRQSRHGGMRSSSRCEVLVADHGAAYRLPGADDPIALRVRNGMQWLVAACC